MTFNRAEATALYTENWNPSFSTMEELLTRIKTLAEAGAYKLCVFVENYQTYAEVFAELDRLGFGVDHYNGGNTRIIEVSWG